MGEQNDHGGKNAKRDVAPDIGARETNHRGRDETHEAEADSGEERLSQESKYTDPPSPLVVDWAQALASRVPARRRALDVAMGRGRHVLPVAYAGFQVFGVDIRPERVLESAVRAGRAGIRLRGWSADLTTFPLPREHFELVVVTRYLERDLFDSLRDALVPGGAIIYETFTVAQLMFGRGPTSPNHLLRHGELRSRFEGFDVLLDEEVAADAALARFVGIKPHRD